MAVVTHQIIREFLAALDLPEDAGEIRIPVGTKEPIEVMVWDEPLYLASTCPRPCTRYHLVRREDADERPTALMGMDIGLALQQALGLPRETTYIGIEVELKRDSIVRVNAYYYPNHDALQRCQEVLSHYRVAELGETTVREGNL
jgi:hypothetical protein